MEELVPSFVPPLANVLAAAAAKKGSPLTEIEVTAIRDSAPCMMIARAVYEKLQESREFRDVNPANCWADWHRLKTQLTGQGYLPKLIMCAVGNAALEADIRAVLQELKSDFTVDSVSGRDERMLNAFACCNVRADPSVTEEDTLRVQTHTTVVYIVSDNYTAAEGKEMCLEMLKVIRSLLLRNPTVAIKCESSGVTHGTARWLELAAMAESDQEVSVPFALFRSFVMYPISSEDGDFYSCGMHLLGLPDLIIEASLLTTSSPPMLNSGLLIQLHVFSLSLSRGFFVCLFNS